MDVLVSFLPLLGLVLALVLVREACSVPAPGVTMGSKSVEVWC